MEYVKLEELCEEILTVKVENTHGRILRMLSKGNVIWWVSTIYDQHDNTERIYLMDSKFNTLIEQWMSNDRRNYHNNKLWS